MNKVSVGRMPGILKEIQIFDGDTVKAVLDRAGMSAQGLEIRVNEDIAQLNTVLKAEDRVVLTKPIKGNNY